MVVGYHHFRKPPFDEDMGLIDMGLIFQVFTSLWIGKWRCRHPLKREGPSGKTGPRPGPETTFHGGFCQAKEWGSVRWAQLRFPLEKTSCWIWWFFVGKRYVFSYKSLVFSVLVCLAIGYDFPHSQHAGKFHLRSSLGHGWHYLPLGSECFSPIGTKSTSVSPALSFGVWLSAFFGTTKNRKTQPGSVESAGDQTCWYVDICIHVVHNVFH